MTHLTDDELVLHYYRETERGDQPRVEAHLEGCGECRAALDRLHRALQLVESAPAPEPRPGFERDVWARLEPALDHPRAGWLDWFRQPSWAMAGGLAALVVAAFVAGRFTGGTPAAPASRPVVATSAPAATDGVLRAAVGDHLDRSQMMLVELVNSDSSHPEQVAADQARAADLVAASRLYRQSAELSGDTAIADVLDELERVLMDVANAPEAGSSKALSDLKTRVDERDLLFRVRVMAAELRRGSGEDGAPPVRKGPTS